MRHSEEVAWFYGNHHKENQIEGEKGKLILTI